MDDWGKEITGFDLFQITTIELSIFTAKNTIRVLEF